MKTIRSRALPLLALLVLASPCGCRKRDHGSHPSLLVIEATSPTSLRLTWPYPGSSYTSKVEADVFRNGVKIVTTSYSTYEDKGLSPDRSFSYTVSGRTYEFLFPLTAYWKSFGPYDGVATTPPATPYAESQDVWTLKQTQVEIKLSGSYAPGIAPQYSIASGPSNGVLSGSPPFLTYTPDPDFNGLDSFTFTAGQSGNYSPPATVSITVWPWGPTTPVELLSAGHAGGAKAAVDGDGNVTSVWVHGMTNVWANRYEASSGWGSPVLIESNDAMANSLDLAVDSAGTVTAIWKQGEGIWSNRWIPGTGWGDAVLLDESTSTIGQPRVAVDSWGIVTAIWIHVGSVFSCRHVPETGWESPTLVEFIGPYGDSPQLAADSEGNVVAIWRQSTGGASTSDIYSNRYEPATGWGTPVLLETTGADAFSPQITIDPAGNVTAVWSQGAPLTGIWANRYIAESGWGTAVLIQSGNNGNAEGPQVVADSEGTVTVVWSQDNGTRFGIRSKRYVPGAGWGSGQSVESGTYDATEPKVVVNANGEPVVVWESAALAVCASRLVGVSWEAPIQLNIQEVLINRNPQLAASPAGNVIIAIWTEYEGFWESIWSCRYDL